MFFMLNNFLNLSCLDDPKSCYETSIRMAPAFMPHGTHPCVKSTKKNQAYFDQALFRPWLRKNMKTTAHLKEKKCLITLFEI